jgi:hypothetical protein
MVHQTHEGLVVWVGGTMVEMSRKLIKVKGFGGLTSTWPYTCGIHIMTRSQVTG